MSKVICIGSATKDIFFPTNEGVIFDTPEDVTAQKKIAFELGAKYHIAKRYEALGGCSVNVAVGLARLGESVRCQAAIGNDTVGEWIGKQLVKEGITVDEFETITGSASDLSAIIVDEKSGERTIFSNHDASLKFSVKEKYLSDADWVFVSDLSGDWRKKMQSVISAAQKNNIKIAFNPRQQMLHDDCAYVCQTMAACAALFVNKDEAIEIISSANKKQGMKNDDELLNDEEYLIGELKKSGTGVVVITDGIRGAWGHDGNELLHVDALVVDAVDTTGSGDAFSSGFLGAYIKGKSLEESLKWGIINSSNSVKFYGGQEGLLDVEKIEAVARSLE